MSVEREMNADELLAAAREDWSPSDCAKNALFTRVAASLPVVATTVGAATAAHAASQGTTAVGGAVAKGGGQALAAKLFAGKVSSTALALWMGAGAASVGGGYLVLRDASSSEIVAPSESAVPAASSKSAAVPGQKLVDSGDASDLLSKTNIVSSEDLAKPATVPAEKSALPVKPKADAARFTALSSEQKPREQRLSRDLAAQVKLLARADQAIRAGEGQRARTLLRKYRSRHSGNALAQEAEGLQIMADCVANRPSARRHAAQFIARHTGGKMEARIRSLCTLNAAGDAIDSAEP